MGRIGYVLEDAHHRITMWDLGGNPIGIIDADSGSTLEFGPVTGAASSTTDIYGVSPVRERQTLGMRDVRMYYEGWKRSGNTTYGAVGDFSSRRSDEPYSQGLERRTKVARSNLMAILAGRLPLVKTDRIQYALRALLADPEAEDRYLTFVSNSSGDYLDLDGAQVDPPDFFVPDELEGRTTAIGLHSSFRIAPTHKIAIGYDFANHELNGKNVGFRNASEVVEERPYRTSQATYVGRVGALEMGIDGRYWKSSSDQTWVFTTSAGTAVDPLSGRGKLLDRKEEGSAMRARARWLSGAFEFGAGLSTDYREVELTPPLPTDESSLNHFLNVVFHREGADTLVLTDSIVHNIVQDRSYEAGAGAAWKVPNGKTTVALEARTFQSQRGQELTGLGPKLVGFDLRSGVEHLLGAVLVRGGYGRRTEDRDDFTEHNEFLIHTASIGVGYKQPRANWALDAGYNYEWVIPDFQDETNLRSSRQFLSTRIRWVF
jgi:hypothetical protein